MPRGYPTGDIYGPTFCSLGGRCIGAYGWGCESRGCEKAYQQQSERTRISLNLGDEWSRRFDGASTCPDCGIPLEGVNVEAHRTFHYNNRDDQRYIQGRGGR